MESARIESAAVIGVVEVLMPAIELSATPGLVVVVVAGAMVALSIAVPLSDLLQAPTATSVTSAVIAVIALVRIFLLVFVVMGRAAVIRTVRNQRLTERTPPVAQTTRHHRSGDVSAGRAWLR
jgi:hypothetical protein